MAWLIRKNNILLLRGVVRLQQISKLSQSIDLKDEIRNSIKNGSGNVIFSPYSIQKCAVGTSFSEAFIRPTCCLVDNQGEFQNPELISERQVRSGEYTTYGIEFSTLYPDILRMLDESNGDHLNPLKDFLENIDYHTHCMRRLLRGEGTHIDRITETEVAILLAIHLFSNLADLNYAPTPAFPKIPVKYLVSKDIYSGSLDCPCSCGRTVIYGNTNIGTPALYHGKPDIMVFPGGGIFSIAVPKSRDQFYKGQNEEEEDNFDDDYSALNDNEHISEISAQTLTFAYYQKVFQHKYRNGSSCIPHVSLIPIVAISKNYFDIYMYDVDHDIFLKNRDGPIPLWNEKYADEHNATLSLSSVFMLWMVVNHLKFRPKLPQSAVNILGRSCGFQTQLSNDRSKEIESTITIGKDVKVPNPDRVIDIAPMKMIQ